jgi:hypothetical protein
MGEPKKHKYPEVRVGQQWQDTDRRGPKRVGEVVAIDKATYKTEARARVRWRVDTDQGTRETWVKVERLGPPAYKLVSPEPPKKRSSAKTPASARANEQVVTVTAKCVSCGTHREIKAGEIPQGDHPHCQKCYMPMVAVQLGDQ